MVWHRWTNGGSRTHKEDCTLAHQAMLIEHCGRHKQEVATGGSNVGVDTYTAVLVRGDRRGCVLCVCSGDILHTSAAARSSYATSDVRYNILIHQYVL